MKVYKNVINYEIEIVTNELLNTEDLSFIQHSIQSVLNKFNRLNSHGKLVVDSKEIEL